MERNKVPAWIKLIRKVRRQLQIETQQPQEKAKVWRTSIKDRLQRQSNNVKREDYGDL